MDSQQQAVRPVWATLEEELGVSAEEAGRLRHLWASFVRVGTGRSFEAVFGISNMSWIADESPDAIRRAIRAGRLGAAKVGNRWVVPLSVLLDWTKRRYSALFRVRQKR